MWWSSSQVPELIIVLFTVQNLLHFVCGAPNALVRAQSKGGSIKPGSMSPRFSALIGAAQGILYLSAPIIYIGTLVSCGMRQPAWMSSLALPNAMDGVVVEGMWINATRVLACVTDLALQRLTDKAFEHLDDQFHPLGRREKGRVIQTGPYAWVRHPMYTNLILQLLIFGFMFWSYAPLFMIVPAMIVLGIKIPIEEEGIQRMEETRDEYRVYMKRVPARLIPYVW